MVEYTNARVYPMIFPPGVSFNYLVIVLSPYFHKGELYYMSIPLMFLEMMLQRSLRYEKVDIVYKQRK